MINNVSLEKAGHLLQNAESVLIFPHINPDGDALGSSAALCRVLRNNGINAWVLLEEDVPEYLKFMDTEFCTQDQSCIDEPDICVCVDCSEEKRFPGRVDIFNSGRLKLCIDHHVTSGSFGDYYYIDGDEAATAQIIYKLLLAMGAEIDSCVGSSLYVGISTDTGNFQYSNTTSDTHIIAAELLKKGIDHMGIMVALYQNRSLARVRLESMIVDRMEIFSEGRAAVSYVDSAMLEKVGAMLEDAETAIDTLRDIEGIEIAAFIKEKDDAVKVSMRAKYWGRVDEIAVRFGGGGHAKAAGCTMHMAVDEAIALIKKEITNYLEK
ncbi:MAG: bifunctional oligoribonuclease/PAP phosphatase NrnA [Bacillota bacterium]|nr:bifunctional oligoribonuclease/PAP phosphatase NrnA [Bacillota bacterium]